MYLCLLISSIMNYLKIAIMILLVSVVSCNRKENAPATGTEDTFEFVIDRFADIEIMRYRVDDWDQLSLKQKELVYYLSQAALCGRDIIYDQNCRYNLRVRGTIDNIVGTYSGDRQCEEWQHFMEYAKRFWFSNGMHHHYANDKFFPDISKEYFNTLLAQSDTASFPYTDGENYKQFATTITDIIFNPKVAAKRTFQDTGKDLVTNSAVNFYEGVTQKEAEGFYSRLAMADGNDPQRPLSHGLNSKLCKNENGELVEQVYRIGGLYSEAISQIVYWLDKAAAVAENDAQKEHILKLIDYYKSGNLQTWDDYNILWVQDTKSLVDYVNGFIEVYTDPMGRKATWEAVVDYKDLKNSKRAEIISQNAQWFEDHSPVDALYKKKVVKGVEAKVSTVAHLGGDCYPATPIGINLPNANWIRKEHGSKSVTMENLMYAYAQARLKNGSSQEFYDSKEDLDLLEKYGYISDNLQVDLHECLGHGSGQMLHGVSDSLLKNYHSTIEEARADLFSLYYIADPKIVELGLLPNAEAYKACYYKYILNGLMLQLNRINLGDQITEAHMRNRALIARWCYEKGEDDNVIEKVTRDGKTYIKINDYDKLRKLFGKLLGEIQKIKSTGDYEAAKDIVETYGVRIDPVLHKEVKRRYEALNIAPYGGFVNPEFVVTKDGDKIKDISLRYPTNYVQQMLNYDKQFHFIK